MPPDDSSQLADALLVFVRSFGLHRSDSTPCGMPVTVGEAHALMEMANGPLGQTELGHRLGLTKSTVSRLVTILEERGWVERFPDANDRRATRLLLTDDGKRITTRLAEARQQRFRMLLEAIPPTRRDDVLDVLTTLTDAARATDPGHA